MRRLKAISLLLGVILLAGFLACVDVSYERLGERFEDLPVVSLQAQFEKTESPVFPREFVDSLDGRIIGYRYVPSDGSYIIYVRGRLPGSAENEDYDWLFNWLKETYRRHVSRAARHLRAYLSTGDRTQLVDAEFEFNEAVKTRARLESLKRGQNVTAVVLERWHPLVQIRGFLPLFEALLILFLGITAAVLTPLLAPEMLDPGWKRRGLGLLLTAILLAILLLGPLHSATKERVLLEGFGREGNLSMACRMLVYGVELNKNSAAEILAARDYSIAYSPYTGEGGERGVELVLKGDDANQLLEALSRETSIIGVWNSSSAFSPFGGGSGRKSAEFLERASRDVVRDIVTASGGKTSEGEARGLLGTPSAGQAANLTESPGGFNCTLLILLFGVEP